MKWPLVRDMRVARVFNPRNLLPCSCALQGSLEAECGPALQPPELLELWGADASPARCFAGDVFSFIHVH